jgi:glucose 1-dehydrogenase
MVRETTVELGPLDIAVANAYYSKREPVLDMSIEGIQRTIDVTLYGAFHVAQASAR